MGTPQFPYASQVFTAPEARDLGHKLAAKIKYIADMTGSRAAADERARLPDEMVEWLDRHGFTHGCSYEEGRRGPFTESLKTISYTDPSGAVRVTTRYNGSPQFKPLGAMHTFWTYFDDGSVVVTWCKEDPRTKSTPRLESRATSGTIDEDYRQHCRRVEALRGEGKRPVHVETIDDVIAVENLYERELIPGALAWLVVVMWVQPYLIVPAFGL